MKTQLPFASGLPRPIPIVIVGGGPAAVIVTEIAPGVVTVNVWILNEPTGTTPVNVSVVTVADGAAMLFAEDVDPPHAARPQAAPAARIRRRSRALIVR